mmetsp:Transcript_39475/g.51677  ORF Transcript_39475/g.51677 Transcript_39475/m.51677 type:complete len:84 (+) Transcript_39475:1008-1259(+)
MWCPELADVPNEYIHDPWNMPLSLQKQYKVRIGGEKPTDESTSYYPSPVNCAKYTSPEAAKKIKRKPAVGKQSTLGAFAKAKK